MGRYYTGDIEGKFWFGVQDSTDASFFGGNEYEPHTITYEFFEDDTKDIEEGIQTCLKELGEYREKLDTFFNDNNGYNDEMIEKALKIPSEKVRTILQWYARLGLGEKIQKCVKDTGSCTFEAEL